MGAFDFHSFVYFVFDLVLFCVTLGCCILLSFICCVWSAFGVCCVGLVIGICGLLGLLAWVVC